MPVTREDLYGNPVSGADPEALAAVDAFAEAMTGYDASAPAIIKAAARRPDHGLLNLYAGMLFMLMESPEGVVRARPFLKRAEGAELNARERPTAHFLAAWIEADIPRALQLGEAIIEDWPRDVVMGKLVQYLAFNLGDAPRMLRSALASLAAAPDIAAAHANVAFGYEECHLFGEAERAAGSALELNSREPWAQHALAHVMLTQGRIDEGARFMEAAWPGWEGLTSFMATHNWWHLALFWLSQGRDREVLDAFDDRCWAMDQAYSQDQAGAVSLLARAEMAGIDTGARWAGVAEAVAARGLDVEQPFLALHYLYALARTGDPGATHLLEAIRRRAETAPAFARGAWADAALPAAEGIVAHLCGDHARAIRELGRALPRLAEIGGSHAQRDLFEQIWIAALVADARWSAAQQALERRRAFDPTGAPLNRALARAYEALGLPDQAAEALARTEAAAARWPA